MNNQTSQEPSMNWHKFLIYFALWFGALTAVVNGVQLLTGSQYGTEQEAAQVYAYFDGLKGVDTVFGILLIATAVYLIYTRFQLAGLKQGAPNKLLIAYGLNIVVNIGYMIALNGIVSKANVQLDDRTMVAQIAANVVLILVNRAYYKKRAFLFEGGSVPLTGMGTEQPGTVSPAGNGSAGGGTMGTNAPADRYCTHCGKKADPGDQWCTSCGTKLD